MSPLPAQFTDRWRPGRAGPSYDDSVCWHLLLGGHPEVRAIAAEAQRRLAPFGGLQMTPEQWLHVTVRQVGPVEAVSQDSMDTMLATAQAILAGFAPVTVSFGRVFYHPEAIALTIVPTKELTSIFDAAQAATSEVTGASGGPAAYRPLIPHMTLCYSTGEQAAAPVIAALGKTLPGAPVTIDGLSLVVQNGPEQEWDWRVAGTARILG